jgi:membrane-bound ClpP family serine protease
MSTATLTFMIIGGLGLLVLALGLLGLDLINIDSLLPVEAVAATIGAFGFTAAIAHASLGTRTPFPLLLAAGAGAVAAVPAGWLALRLMHAAQRMPTDATPARDDLIGLLGVVVTPIPERGYGEVRVTLGGQPVKLNATADAAVPLGARVFVITAPSETSVVVERLPQSPEQHGVY